MPELPQSARFWMICRRPAGPNSKTEPRQRYSSFADAERAAEKLAAQNDAEFTILETVAVARPTDQSFGSLL
ncbi:hypothetical protein HKX54_02235 [Sulfitobacter sp. M57]|uniref:hypothetical protein n=1 Tax=unclassified Sulfitobacter TaxID=196795 RepID=UPI0023E20346|nr:MULTISPECIES: hypothetical protein [unclassified Sulfitobacter]MDF3413259.1 hypothetical protein [Sulfitobacter sp. KE5]MDF3421459.1 hypothetical protein [Sulfitobacter sp. KE43]MDF3431807.1 hypothetical protein [Sulfitobacter sp. KE42]MDF3457447.1 hypothetical protein [Sulfitobacter sp. S74]MDF3461350.1 hypothetical protein [Sulfitobacter sp. Ks18]